MKRKTNLFYLTGPDSKFITFSNYTESLTGNFLSTDTKLFPSRFLCLNIKGLTPDNKPALIKYLSEYYESKMAVLRDNCIDKNENVEHTLLPLNYLLEALYKITGFTTTKVQYADEPGDYDVITIPYVSDVTEQDYNGTFTDTICVVNLNNVYSAEPNFKIDTSDIDDNTVRIELPRTTAGKRALYGWESNCVSEYSDAYSIFDNIDGDATDIVVNSSSENNSVEYLDESDGPEAHPMHYAYFINTKDYLTSLIQKRNEVEGLDYNPFAILDEAPYILTDFKNYDINGDGEISNEDTSYILNYVLGDTSYTNSYNDVDNDGNIDSDDVLLEATINSIADDFNKVVTFNPDAITEENIEAREDLVDGGYYVNIADVYTTYQYDAETMTFTKVDLADGITAEPGTIKIYEGSDESSSSESSDGSSDDSSDSSSSSSENSDEQVNCVGEYYINSFINRLDITKENNVDSVTFNAVLPLFDVVDINYKSNMSIIEDIWQSGNQYIDLEDSATNDLYTMNVPLGMWFYVNKDDSYNTTKEDDADSSINTEVDTCDYSSGITMRKDPDTGYSQSWSLVISSQFKPFPYSKAMPNEVYTNSTSNAFATFAEVLSNQNKLMDQLSDLQYQFTYLNNRISNIQGQLKQIGTTYNIDGIHKELVNYEMSMNETYKEFKEEVLAYVANFKWKSTV